MKRSTDRIITTHVGSLPRPHDLLDMLSDKINGRPYDEAAFEARVKQSIEDVVKIQADAGIDVVNDGEQSIALFFSYVLE
jgi:5-methyltetrahydropteroyltriglutamate--homocysteine methyltransferase